MVASEERLVREKFGISKLVTVIGDQRNVGTTPGMGGDYHKALKTIKARTLILAGSGDLLNPEYDAKEAAHYIPHVRYVEINAARPLGHLSGAGATAPENEMQNREIGAFLSR
jgi:homoserine O-acetyltransferase